MGIFDFARVFGESEDDMTKKSKLKKVAAEPSRLVAEFAARLARTGTDKNAFDEVLMELKAEHQLASSDIIAIAHMYSGGGKKTTSKSAAYSAISKRFVEIVRYHAKNKIAEKARPW